MLSFFSAVPLVFIDRNFDSLGVQPILPVKVSIIINSMLNFDDEFDRVMVTLRVNTSQLYCSIFFSLKISVLHWPFSLRISREKVSILTKVDFKH